MCSINLIFPHQLFRESPLLKNKRKTYIIEESLFFKQYNFHQQKIAFHRASMKYYQTYLEEKNTSTHYIDSNEDIADIRKLLKHLAQNSVSTISYLDTTDNWLEKRITATAKKHDLTIQKHESRLFLNSIDDIKAYFYAKGKFYQTDFYTNQRKERNILLEKDNSPVGGKWTFDSDNRKKYPKKKTPPKVIFPKENTFYNEAKNYTKKHYKENYGQLNEDINYPCTYEEAEKWLTDFLETRFKDFGPYEDAIVSEEHFLHHSLLTPMLNVGLITPQQIIDKSLDHASKNDIPINSLEGFLRQVMGWREFMRGVYELKGVEERTKNFWNFDRKIPKAFWEGTTGIPPVDETIKKVLKTGYCHHIERLMVLGNFMLLCEFDPDEVYRWFMELFIDAYDWVMVPNVYGMSQFADGGIMSTKPYISGSNYIMKMSNYPKGDWQDIWDALFWRFLYMQKEFFSKNPRMNMLVKSFEKWPQQKKEDYLNRAKNYLISISVQE